MCTDNLEGRHRLQYAEGQSWDLLHARCEGHTDVLPSEPGGGVGVRLEHLPALPPLLGSGVIVRVSVLTGPYVRCLAPLRLLLLGT